MTRIPPEYGMFPSILLTGYQCPYIKIGFLKHAEGTDGAHAPDYPAGKLFYHITYLCTLQVSRREKGDQGNTLKTIRRRSNIFNLLSPIGRSKNQAFSSAVIRACWRFRRYEQYHTFIYVSILKKSWLV